MGEVSNYLLQQIPKRAVGYVHSVFKSGINIKINNSLVYVGSPENTLSCIGMTLQRETIKEIVSVVQRNDQVVITKQTIRIYARERVIEIDFSDFSVNDMLIPKIGESLLLLEKDLESVNFNERVGLEQDESFSEVKDILTDLTSPDEKLDKALKYLVGRGLGLTPSGDDILAGYGMGMIAYGYKNRLLEKLKEALFNKTTDVSIAYLLAMKEGYANEDWIWLLNAVEDKDQLSIEKKIKAIGNYGNTSGYDSLLGLYIAILGLKRAIADRSEVK